MRHPTFSLARHFHQELKTAAPLKWLQPGLREMTLHRVFNHAASIGHHPQQRKWDRILGMKRAVWKGTLRALTAKCSLNTSTPSTKTQQRKRKSGLSTSKPCQFSNGLWREQPSPSLYCMLSPLKEISISKGSFCPRGSTASWGWRHSTKLSLRGSNSERRRPCSIGRDKTSTRSMTVCGSSSRRSAKYIENDH